MLINVENAIEFSIGDNSMGGIARNRANFPACRFPNRNRAAFSNADPESYHLPRQRSRSFPGDGYTCYPDAEVTTTDEPPKPQCIEEMCWCSSGWEYRNNECVRQEEETRTADYDRDCK